ncbi:glycosyltransferase family 2 protein [Microbacterium trichothecenolyticum]|uniref:glycosyltransferase family 2 protein n=1 Tax=Microbacterium trichothecenolyticum TaxID=69370 RepID=UPI0021D64BA2|nr:glycosyltransferase family 2 protein [Microbacterium trichothecenolyticum]
MATFNRPADCAAQLIALAGDEEALEVLDRIIVVDQGTDPVTAQPGFVEAGLRLRDRLTLIAQENLGGSGGFSRAMFETVTRGESDYVLLLDDDAISEPEAVIRAVAFADAARGAHRPVIVGGGMLHLDDRTRLYAQAEQWNSRIGWVDLSRSEAYDHDFARSSFRRSPYWHRTHRADFNGWWFCLVPAEILRRAGLALPLFLKGDDVEFARRASEAGVATVSLPGVAVWHLGWGGKAPTRTWEAYFLHRNRLIGELLHAGRRRPLGVILHSLLGDLKPLLMLQYSAVRLRAQAMDDVFAGPAQLPGWLRDRPAEIRRMRDRFPDAGAVDAGRFPPLQDAPVAPHGRLRAARLLARTWARHILVPESASSRRSPEVRVGPHDLGWWTFAGVDSALVDAPDGTSTSWYRRSRSMTLEALGGSLRRHVRLWWKWPGLARTYRGAAPDLASMTSWARVFGDDR